MKIELKRLKDIQILSVSGDIGPHQIAVLKAGVTKLFKDGKNKIIIELTNAQTLGPEILRELGVLNLLASELAGRIVLSGVSAEVKKRIESFAKPPVVTCFETTETAVASFAPAPDEDAGEASDDIAAAKEAPANKAPAGNLLAELKKKVQEKETTTVTNLRKEIEKLKAENTNLQKSLLALVIQRAAPTNQAAYDEKIKILENKLEEALQKAEEADR